MLLIPKAHTVAHIQCVPLAKPLVVLGTISHLYVTGKGLQIPPVPSLVVMANTEEGLVMEQRNLIFPVCIASHLAMLDTTYLVIALGRVCKIQCLANH